MAKDETGRNGPGGKPQKRTKGRATLTQLMGSRAAQREAKVTNPEGR